MIEKSFKRAVLDIETNGLMNQLLDFTTYPLRLKDTARLWCICIRDLDNLDDVITLRREECTRDNLKSALRFTKELAFHNGIAYDMPMLFLFDMIDYRVGYEGESDTIYSNQEILFIDTLIISKLLRQDRFGGHSVESWGYTLGVPKIDFHDFENYSEEMVLYCEGDVLTQANIYHALMDEVGGEDEWLKLRDKAYRLELKLADLTLAQELRGFWFDRPAAEEGLKYFQGELDTIAAKVNPLLPPRPLNKGEQKDFLPPKNQFKKDGTPSAHLLKFIEKIEAEYHETEEEKYLIFEGKKFTLPIQECIKTTLPGSIDNLDYLKAYLLDLGWDPLEWKERDLTKDSKKHKLTGEKLDATIQRYVDSTLNGPYKWHRLNLLGIKDENKLLSYLLNSKDKFSLMVPVSPLIRVGTEKKLCPNLTKLGEDAEFALDVTRYLTFKHRRNSIAGSKEDDDGEPLSGYISQIRADSRVSTPADTLGANGGRYKHRGIANIPRVSSPGGEIMRSLFSCGPGRKQLGFDFASLEARINGHFVLPYTDGEALAASLIAEKPNDCFDMSTQILSSDGWITSSEITEDTLLAQWNTNKIISYSKPKSIIHRNHTGEMIVVKGERLDIRVTPNHRFIVFDRDTNEYYEVLGKDLKQFSEQNPNSYIPSNGYTISKYNTCNMLDVLNKDTSLVNVLNSDSCITFQSKDYQTILNLATDQRVKGSSSLIITKDLNGEPLYQTSSGKAPLNQDGFKLIPSEISVEKIEQEDVWCVSVPTSYVIVKRNNSIYVAGNCHSINAKKLGITRDNAKSFSYAVMYGAQPEKLAKMLRISVKEAERLFDAYWEAVPALKELRDKVESYWKKTGKQYIMGIDKRKLFVRSQHSLVNLLFQSAGAICVKYTIVGICKRLEEQGLLGHPLYDTNEESKKKVYLMIVYHDEAQFDCPEDFLTWHFFDTEEEAKEATKLHPGSSAISHNEKGYFFSEENLLSIFINEEIYRVCMDLDLRVPLGMEYITGMNWGECH